MSLMTYGPQKKSLRVMEEQMAAGPACDKLLADYDRLSEDLELLWWFQLRIGHQGHSQWFQV